MNLEKQRTYATGPAGAGDYNLPYDRLAVPEIFESFCSSLLILKEENSHNTLSVSAKSTGGRGCKQLGGDIIIEVIDNNNHTHYDLYDCKGGDTLSVSKYKKAIDKFIENHSEWKFKFSSFSIISASPISAMVFIEASEQKSRLQKIGVQHHIYGAEDIKEWMKSVYSDNLVAEYFGKEYIERLWGAEGLWQLENKGVWGKLKNNSWDSFQGEEESKTTEPYTFKNEFVSILAYLPKPERQTISCFIDLRHHDYNHLLLTLSQEFLLRRAFEGTGTPPEAECRAWFFKVNENEYVCDFGNCRIPLPYNSVKGVCAAFDKLWLAYKEKIIYIQDLFCTSHFRDKGYCSESVPIMEIPLWIWHRLYKFCEYNDYINTEGEWSIFNAVKNKIMVFNHSHSDIFPSQNVSFRIAVPKYSDEFNVRDAVILWESPQSHFLVSETSIDEVIRSGKYSDAVTTHDWLKDVLIPNAFNWFENNKNAIYSSRKSFLSLFKRSRKELLNTQLINSLYNDESWTGISAIDELEVFFDLVVKLQEFYHGSPDYISFSRDDMHSLYQALSILISNTDFHYLNYICGCMQAYPATYDNLLLSVERLKNRVKNYQKQTTLIDMIFRAFIACRGDGKLDLNKHQVKYLCQLIFPFADKMNDRELLMRQKMKHKSY